MSLQVPMFRPGSAPLPGDHQEPFSPGRSPLSGFQIVLDKEERFKAAAQKAIDEQNVGAFQRIPKDILVQFSPRIAQLLSDCATNEEIIEITLEGEERKKALELVRVAKTTYKQMEEFINPH